MLPMLHFICLKITFSGSTNEAMKKFWLGLVLISCFAVPYAAQAQVVVVVHPHHHHHYHHRRHHAGLYLNQ